MTHPGDGHRPPGPPPFPIDVDVPAMLDRLDRLAAEEPTRVRDVVDAVLAIRARTIPPYADDTTMTRVAGYNECLADVIRAMTAEIAAGR